jgi:hypothetical protein
VQKLKYKDDLRGIETRRVLVETFCSAEVGEYFAARAVIELGSSLVLGASIEQGRWPTSIYKESWSEKVVIKVVINGWPATSARTLRSWFTWSTCLSLMTTHHC